MGEPQIVFERYHQVTILSWLSSLKMAKVLPIIQDGVDYYGLSDRNGLFFSPAVP